MRNFWKPHFVGVGSKPPGSPSGEPAHAAGNSFTFSARTAPNTRLIRWIIIFGIALVAVIITATGLMLLSLRDRELAESEHEPGDINNPSSSNRIVDRLAHPLPNCGAGHYGSN